MHTYHWAILSLSGLDLWKFLLLLAYGGSNLCVDSMIILGIAFSLALSPRSATETDLEETLGGDEDAAEGDRDDKADLSVVLVFSFLGDLVHVFALEVGDSRSSE